MASVFTGAIFSLLPINGLLLGISMYTIENVTKTFLFSNSKHSNRFFYVWKLFFFQSEFYLIVFVFDMLCVICALMWCSLFCYFANMASDRLSSIGNASYLANWYNYPMGWQKFIILIIARSQKPIYFDGLGFINCNLEVFGKVSDESNFLNIFQHIFLELIQNKSHWFRFFFLW